MRKLTSFLLIFQLFFATLSFAGNDKAESKEETAAGVSTILLIATAYAGIEFITECQRPSALVFSMGAISFIFGEVKNWDNYKEASDLIAKEYEGSDPTEVEKQIKALNSAEKATREAQTAAEERASNAKSAATMFLVAAVVAIIEFIVEIYCECEFDECQDSGGSSYFSPLLKTLFPEAYAQANSNNPRAIGLVSAAAIASLTTAREGITELMGQAKKNGIIRAAIFGGFALVANEVASLTEDAADIYKEQADEYARLRNKLIAKLKQNPMEFDKLNLDDLGTMNVIETGKADLSKPKFCGTEGPNSDFKVDKDCNCLKTNECKQVSMPELKMNKMEVPSAVNSSLKTFSTMTNASYRGDNATADLARDDLLKNSARIRKLKDDLQEATNKSLTKNGMTPINFKEQEKLFADEIKSLFSKGITPEGKALLSDFFGTSIKIPAQKTKKKDKEIQQSIKKRARALSSPLVKKAIKKSKNPLDGFFLLAEEENKEALDQGTALSQYKTNENDINKKKNESIFKIISIRYLKSAFPVLFEE